MLGITLPYEVLASIMPETHESLSFSHLKLSEYPLQSAAKVQKKEEAVLWRDGFLIHLDPGA